jgi:hypothetical protein
MAERHDSRLVSDVEERGRLFRGDVDLGPVDYRIQTWQDVIITEAGGVREEVLGMEDRRIYLAKAFIESGTLTLQLANGQRMQGFLNGRRFVPGNA